MTFETEKEPHSGARSRSRHGERGRRASPSGEEDPARTRPRSRIVARPARARRVPRRSPSASRPTSRTTASAPPGRRRRRASARGAASSASCCRSSTTSSGRWPPPRTGEQHLAEGVRLVHSELDRRARAQRRRAVRPGRRAVRPDRARGALDAREEGASRASCSTSSRRATAPTARSCVRRAWWSQADDGRRHGPLQDARRRQEGLRRRDQEGLPQARAPVPPGQEPGRQGGRGALQGGPGRVRDPVRPREAQAVRLGRRHLRRRLPGRRLRRARRRSGRRLRRLRRHPLRPVRRRRPAAAARAAARSAAATSRPRCTSRSSRRWRAARSGHRAARRRPARPATAPARSRAPRPTVCTRCQGRGVEARVAGPVLDLAAVPPVRRHRHRDQGPVPDLPGLRPDPPGQALRA